MIVKNFAAVVLCLYAVSAHAEELRARGVVRSLAEATISVDYTARITSLPVLEGQGFVEGDVLIAFDCRRFTAEIAAAQANAHAQELVFANNKRLLSRGAIGANEVKISMAQFEKARSEALAIQARTGACDYRAPFDGRMVQRIAQEHESPAANQPLIRIVDTQRLETEFIVPSNWLGWLKEGQEVDFAIDETGKTVSGQVIRIGATVDAVSQTIKVFGVFSEQDSSVLPGMSGTAMFPRTGS
jgi:membrane fusion protein, multidrug efflux system